MSKQPITIHVVNTAIARAGLERAGYRATRLKSWYDWTYEWTTGFDATADGRGGVRIKRYYEGQERPLRREDVLALASEGAMPYRG